MILLISIVSFIVHVSSKAPQNDREIRDMLTGMLKDYDPKLRPNYLGSPVEVSVDATVLSISNINEVKMVYTLDMFFRQRWKDERLRHELTDNLTLVMGDDHPADFIWVPATVFIDSVSSKMHHVIVNNHKIDINYDGSVFWGTRVTVSPSCHLDLRSYPMDRHRCRFELVSYAYTSRHVVYKWKGDGLQLYPDMPQMAQFELTAYNTIRKEILFVAGNYTVLFGTFDFHRLMGFAIMQVYIPTICVVMVSWISFWVKRTVVPARVALLITTLLTISTVWGSVNAQLPRVNYVKAIDIFMMTSFGSIIMALVEFIVVMNTDVVLRILGKYFAVYINFRDEVVVEQDTCEKKKGRSSIYETLVGTNNHFRRRAMDGIHERCRCQRPIDGADVSIHSKNIDRMADSLEHFARIIFPIFYFIFNICYFAFYLGGHR